MSTEKDMMKQNDIGFIYILQGRQYYKIGVALSIDSRIKSFSPSLPFPIKVIFSAKVRDRYGIEAKIHREFRDKHSNGEWFMLNFPDDIETIKKMIIPYQLEIDFKTVSSLLKQREIFTQTKALKAPKVSKDGFIRVQLSYNPDKEPDIDHYIKAAENSGLAAYLKKCIRFYEDSQSQDGRNGEKLDLILSLLKNGRLIATSEQKEEIEAEQDLMFDEALDQI